MSRAFPAQYKGECMSGCGEEIEEGQLIVNIGGQEYVHEGCQKRLVADEDGKRHKFQGTTLEEMGY